MNTDFTSWSPEAYLFFLTTLVSVVLIATAMMKLREYKKKYSPLIDQDAELKKLLNLTKNEQANLKKLQTSYAEKFTIYESLMEEISIFNDQLEYASISFYEPHFDFDTSEEFKLKIKEVRDLQKVLISDKTAIEAKVSIQVGSSKTKGRQLLNKQIRLSLRAFNNECDAAIGNIRWNNIEQMLKRIERAREAIDKLNESLSVVISDKFYDLKVKELLLSHEYRELKQAERDKSTELKRLQREEQKLLKDAENARKEEDKYGKLLDAAKKQAEKAVGEKQKALELEINKLSMSLVEAKENTMRALSMAQKTKAGHVYIISNRGSFGEHVIKIGMTRRLDPVDRIKELGDASVPFTFDLHALIYTEDAPALEGQLHEVFQEFRVNLVNNRKEFFRIPIETVHAEIRKIDPDIDFIFTAEAREYKESIAKAGLIGDKKVQFDRLPRSI